MITLEQVYHAYGEREVLKGLSLAIQPGERLAIMGPSGIGKTTLLRLLAGLEPPQRGRITGLPEEGASVVFQENRLLPQLTVLGNLSLVAPWQPRERLLELLEGLGLLGEGETHPGALSGGMARRVAIARALAFDRQLFLLDEPFKGLDEATAGRVQAFLREKTAGKTVVLITHDRGEALGLGCEIRRLEAL